MYPHKLAIKFDVENLKHWLEKTDLWGEHPQRGLTGSPHEEMTDIWARFNDPSPCIKSGDWSKFVDEHESVWLKDIPELKDICELLMKYVGGERLGGVLVTKLPAGGKIKPHSDSGWHAKYYEKYFLSVKNGKGANFCFENKVISPKEGEVHAFKNDVLHWVNNDSDQDRIAIIICIK